MELNEHYCVKCKAPTTPGDVKTDETRTKNGRTMERGTCPVCNTRTARIR